MRLALLHVLRRVNAASRAQEKSKYHVCQVAAVRNGTCSKLKKRKKASGRW